MKLMGSCSDVLCWSLGRGKSVPVFLNRESTKLILRTKCGPIYEIHRSFAKNRSNFHPFRHNLQISFATLNLTRSNTLITVMHLWGKMEASGGRRYTQLQRRCHKSHTTSHNCSHLLLMMEPRWAGRGCSWPSQKLISEMDGRNLKGRGRRVEVRGGVWGGKGGGGGRTRAVISDEICATVIDHVLVQGNAMCREGHGEQPNQGIQREHLIVSLCSLNVLEVSEFGTAQSCCHMRMEGLLYPPNSKSLSQLVTCSFKTRPFDGDSQ